jgi:arylamine N-acetyltransferase
LQLFFGESENKAFRAEYRMLLGPIPLSSGETVQSGSGDIDLIQRTDIANKRKKKVRRPGAYGLRLCANLDQDINEAQVWLPITGLSTCRSVWRYQR